MSRSRCTKENVFLAFVQGDIWVKLSAIFWGAAWLKKGCVARGIFLLLEEAAILAGLILTWPYVRKLPTLGTVQAQRSWDPAARRNVWNDYDNSFLILLFGVIGLLLAVFFLYQCIRRIKHAADLRRPASLQQELAHLLGDGFHHTLLALPVTGVILTLIIPLLAMILIAFTNYDRNHLVPTNLFTWVGMDNFRLLTDLSSSPAFAHAFPRVLLWTLLWAVAATLSCYMGGTLLALLINHPRTVCKPLWRSCFLTAMAIPQFVSLLLVRSLFADAGILNTLLRQWGVTGWLHNTGLTPAADYIPFLTDPRWARPMILLINLWIGTPYQLLIATGVLMNIPASLAEAARMDGAGPRHIFRHITLPYLLHVTGPSLLSGLVTNINNFSVIWLLTRDVYVTSDQLMAAAGAAETDLLVTWLYRLTQDQSNYKMASVIGILVFAVCSAITLAAFSRLLREGKEEVFQ